MPKHTHDFIPRMTESYPRVYALVSKFGDFFFFVLIVVERPGKQFFSHVETEPPIPGYYQYFLGSKCLLLKETTHRPGRIIPRVTQTRVAILHPSHFCDFNSTFNGNSHYKSFAIFLSNRREFLSNDLYIHSLQRSKQIADEKKQM